MKVLLCVDDDSQYAAVVEALDWCLSLGKDDDVFVAHSVATLRWLPTGGGAVWAEKEREILQRVDDFLGRTVDTVSANGPNAEALRLEGDVAAELLKAADERNVDVIVSGALGQARSQDFLVGSVAEKLESLAETDLLLVRDVATPADARFHALLAVDDTESSFGAVQAFAERCRADRAEIDVVHAMQVPPPRFDADPDDDKAPVPPVVKEHADAAVGRALELLRSHGLEAKATIRRGEPAREILDAAESFGTNLIVVGHGESGARGRRRGWRGTVTKRVARHAPCTVFIAGTGRS